ncbi:bidirectional sugar transporter SWEET15-like [Amaranthus tricolor]|uniref:bidirectional sugar transporter SWEET15-like n=1 Tax=Amaranthus tricolor TaxID=29722 RepID=UPI00258EACB1|nr:bidirectional sugar transporter SWEET15-like [Amaranthus tricolor]
MALHNLSITIVGILGNVISGLVYLAPLPTYYRIYKKRSTEGFQAVPYVVALFSAMLWLYYALLKKKEIFLITINSVGCIIETLYIVFFCVYASKSIRISTAKLVSFHLAIFVLVVIVIQLILVDGTNRVKVLGIICAVVSTCVFAAPLAIMVKVFRTKSVRFMPFQLSFFLTLCAVIWFAYGILRRDLFILIPNIMGFILGLLQMVLYAVCKNCYLSNVSGRNQSDPTELVNQNSTITDNHQTDSEHKENETADQQDGSNGVYCPAAV